MGLDGHQHQSSFVFAQHTFLFEYVVDHFIFEYGKPHTLALMYSQIQVTPQQIQKSNKQQK